MRIRLLLLSVFAFVIGLSACKKNNDAPTAILHSYLNVTNATADTVNFYLNGTRLNTSSNLYPSGSSGYALVTAGNQSYQVKKIFNPITNTVQTLFSIPLKLKANTLDTVYHSSLFIAGETLPQAFSTVDTLNNDTTANTSYVRFVNASPDAGSLDFAISSTVKFKNQAFKSASGFKLVSVNKDTTGLVPINVYQAGGATPIISGKYVLVAGRSYTFYSKGQLAGTGNSIFSVGVTINN